MRQTTWEKPEVALAHRTAVAQEGMHELLEQYRLDPYGYFIRGMEHVLTQDPNVKVLLDIGCGCGHYSDWLGSFFPEMSYIGFDHEVAVDLAKEVSSSTAKFFAVSVKSPDTILNLLPRDGHCALLFSGALEYMTSDPHGFLERLIALTLPRHWIILHRARINQGSDYGRWKSESTYAGNKEDIWYWGPNWPFEPEKVITWYRQDTCTAIWQGQYR